MDHPMTVIGTPSWLSPKVGLRAIAEQAAHMYAIFTLEGITP